MEIETLINLEGFTILKVSCEEDIIEINARSLAREDRCPDCQTLSTQVHSWYERHPRELPCQGKPIRLHLEVQRFFCQREDCPRQTFVENIGSVVVKYAQRTLSMTVQLREVAFEIGGEGGARLAKLIGLPTSPDTLLRIIQQTTIPESPTPKVLGVDDWAFQKGRRYGAILCDLDRHCVIELLPDRESETLEAWLQAHPGVLVISRDRGTNFIEGATKGAPQAMQIADRWHLLKNLREAVQLILDQHRAVLKIKTETATTIAIPNVVQREVAGKAISQDDQISLTNRQHRLVRYQQAVALYRKGISIQEIALTLDLSCETVSKYVKAESFPEIKPHVGKLKAIAPYQTYLNHRWEEGCRNATQLWREISAQGYCHTLQAVQKYIARLHQTETAVPASIQTVKKTEYRRYTPAQAVWFFMRSEDDLESEELQDLKTFRHQSPELNQTYTLTQAFIKMVREQEPLPFSAWIQTVLSTTLNPLRTLASGFLRDRQAVVAALAFPWSQGQVEGQVNRLKTIKHQMYGRAGFSLLRKRVLYQPAV